MILFLMILYSFCGFSQMIGDALSIFGLFALFIFFHIFIFAQSFLLSY
jgi:uncharacterized membrane protein YkvI